MRKIISAALSLLLLLCASVPVWAAENSMDNFQSVRTYAQQFSDVPSSNWAAPSVETCYEYGLMQGVSETEFSPKGNLTVAEALVMACRVRQIYEEGACTLQNGTPWYQPYVDYALSEGIIALSDFDDYTASITRSEMAYIFYNALPQSCYPAINKIGDIPDVDDSVPNYYEIMALYEAGVLTGSNSYGTFYPERSITRAEAAAVISRVAVPSLRQEFSLDGSQDTGEDDESGELSAGEIYNKCAPAVVYIVVYDASGNALRTGSGFFIHSDGTLVTNYHVVEGGASAKITTMDNQVYDVSGVYDCDETTDIALLKVNGSGFTSLKVSTEPVSAGDTIYAIGSPLGLSNTISSGIISNAARVYEGVTYIQVTAPISSGSSGGALIDSQGRAVGITSGEFYSSTNMSQNLNIAVPLTYLDELERSSVTSMSQALAAEEAVIRADEMSVTVRVGQTVTVGISHTSRNAVSLVSRTGDPGIVNCSWNKWTSQSTTSLNITGLTRGTTTVTVGFNEGETSDSCAVIEATVV